MSELSEEAAGPAIPAPEQPNPPPTPAKKLKRPGGKKGRKIEHRSTKPELEREKLTAAIITSIVAGKTINEICAEFGVSDTVVIRIRKDLPEGFIEFFAKAKTNEISTLIEDGLKAQLLALRKIVEVTNDEVWLKGQRAPELATFFGVVSDKTVRVLAAIERANDREQSHVPQPRESPAAPGGVRPTAARPTQEVRAGV
jgi:hypothetical protein